MLSFILMIFLYIFLFLIALGIIGSIASSIEKNGFFNTIAGIIVYLFLFGTVIGGMYFVIERVIS